MSTTLHMPAFNPTPYGLKEKNVESFAPAFTSVNGRTSISPVSHEQKPAQPAESTAWSQPPDNSYHSSSDSASPTISSGDRSPDSVSKRTRPEFEEDSRLRHSPADSGPGPRHPPGPYHPTSREETPRMEPSQHHTLASLNRSEAERRWATEPREVPQNNYQDLQHRQPRPTEPVQNGMPPVSHASLGPIGSPSGRDEVEITRAGVQVELKKRKRQFANRTKTGCGTCRRRKKKCDEAKPECNNCTRGGFICEGYANKIPWPKNGVTKPPPPLQAKERLAAEVASIYARCPVCKQIHIPHCDPPARQNIYPENPAPNGGEGARSRPINVEEHERKPPAPSSWGSGWTEPPPPPPRVSYPPEQPAAQYPQPSSAPTQERPPSHDRHVPPQPNQSVPPRPHNPRVYHHTPQSMSQVVSNPPAVTIEPTTHHHHQVVQHPRPAPSMAAPPSTAPPGPPPTHYVQQPPMHKSEKEKMLAGQPFLPYDRQLADERHLCTGAVNQFNSTSSAAVSIARDERGRHFKTIVAARWIPPRTTERHIGGHLGGNVHVTAPFHCDYGYNLSIADNVVIGPSCQLLDSARICIGRNTKIGARVTISTMKTPTDTKALKGSNGTETAQEVWIGENVYIGDGCIIEAGVKIGDGAIVRSGSVVVRE
ncbi:Nn.00g062420.m01.CDS01 [Neocucurbitaria sp. VM-36]